MATQTLNVLDAIEHLPSGGTLILNDVSWDEYEQLVAALEADRPGTRVTYDQGRLEVMSPTQRHEKVKEIISLLAHLISIEMDCDVENLGSTTYKQKWLQRGVEPDASFYIQNASRIIGIDDMDLTINPPPDIVVEVDVSHSSKTKLKIYAGMGVAELWLHDNQRIHIYQLVEEQYVEVATSRTFPILTGDVLTRFIELSLSEGQTTAARAFRDWLSTQKA